MKMFLVYIKKYVILLSSLLLSVFLLLIYVSFFRKNKIVNQNKKEMEPHSGSLKFIRLAFHSSLILSEKILFLCVNNLIWTIANNNSSINIHVFSSSLLTILLWIFIETKFKSLTINTYSVAKILNRACYCYYH